MALIGKIEKKKDNTAIILVKKILPCGDNCKSCSAGCKFYSIYIQTEVSDDINVGDIVNVKQKDDATLNNRIMQYALPVTLIMGSIIIVNIIPQFENKGLASALAVLGSIIAAQFALKIYDKLQMKKNANHFVVCGKQNPQ